MSKKDDLAYFLDMQAPGAMAVIKDYIRRSRALATSADVEADVPYGEHPLQRFSVAWPKHRADTRMAVLFFHGGWWKSGNKEDRLFLAENLLSEGIALVSAGYPLAPEQRLAHLSDSAVSATRRVVEHLRGALGRPLSLVLSGNSAGAHLAAYVAGALACTEAQAEAQGIVGLCVASGLYDLEPMRQCFANEWLGLQEQDVTELSPIQHLPAPGLPIMLAVGSHEPQGFLDQKLRYRERLVSSGSSPQIFVAAGHDHFSVIAEFGAWGQPLHQWILQRRDALTA